MTLHPLLVVALVVFALLLVGALVLFVVLVGVTASLNRSLRKGNPFRRASPGMPDMKEVV